MQTNLKPNSCLAKAGTLFFDYLVIFAGAVLYGISVAIIVLYLYKSLKTGLQTALPTA
jgi:hypothetical protein